VEHVWYALVIVHEVRHFSV